MSLGWIIFILGTIGFHYGLYGMFRKAGIKPWKALVPYYNTWVMVEKMPLKKYWFFLQFIPIVGQFLEEEMLKKDFNVETDPGRGQYYVGNSMNYMIDLTKEEAERMRKLPYVQSVDRDVKRFNPSVFPNDTTRYRWSEDFYGPIWVPKKGATITLTADNIAFYRRIIQVYEGNKLEEVNGKFIINGKETSQYTFAMNYFWMMGDNRHNSQDSRFWGYVPEDHVVGRVSLIWFSWDKGPRWNRLFRSIK